MRSLVPSILAVLQSEFSEVRALFDIDLPAGVDIAVQPILLFRDWKGIVPYNSAVQTRDFVFELYAQDTGVIDELHEKLQSIFHEKRYLGIKYGRILDLPYITRDPNLHWPVGVTYFRFRGSASA